MTTQTGITVTANGKAHTLQAGTLLPAFIEAIGLAPERVVVEHNGEALTQKEARGVTLQDGDTLEIVRIVPGG